VDRLLTLTFTEKAATEMRERVARRFLGEGRPDLRRAVETAWVSTFHSFCARLLKENAVEAGVDPSFQVLAEGDASLLLEEAREETVARWAAERPDDLAPLALVAAGDFEALLAGLLAEGPGAGRSFADLFAAAADPPPPAGEVEAVRAALRALAPDLDRYGGAAATAARAAVGAGRALDGLDPAAAGPAVLALRGSFRMPGRDPGGAVPAKPRLAALRAACDAATDALLARDAAPAARALAALLDEAAAAFRERKRERGALDFADLEERALRLLEEDAEVREEARSRFDGILVDEFQDTNPAQERLLAALSVPGRRFVVGDPKQAIYGFRGADVAGFGRARAAAGEEGTVLLVENFRSRPEVLRFSNAVLAPAFAAGGGDQVPFERLEPGAAHGPKDGPSVEVHLVGGDAPLGDLRPREAALVAARVRALVAGRETCITRCDNEGKPGGRPLGWGDAAILLRATTDIKVYERALADADVPYQVVKGRGFFEAREVVDLANLLEALEDPTHDLALAATLRSPFAGLDDGALLALVDGLPRSEAGRAPLCTHLAPGARTPAGVSPAMRRRLDRFRASWAGLLDLRRRGRLHGTVDAALRGTGYDLAVLLQPGGRQRAANLRKVWERARAFEEDGLGGPGEFLRLVRRLRLREERETEAPLAAEDAVALLTVHQAKGLEWPLVCIPDLGRRLPAVGGAVLARGGRAGLRVRRDGESVPTPLWRTLRDEETRAEDAESVRLFHVALTRAKEHLVLSACLRGEAGGGDEGEGAPRGDAPKRVTWMGLLAPLLPGPPAEGAAGESDGVAVLAEGTPDEVRVRVARTEGAPGGGTAARRVSLAALRRKRLLAGRGPGARIPAKERRAVEGEVAAVLDLPPVPRDGTPYLTTVSAVLDFEACPLRYYLGHVVGAPDRAPPSVGEPAPSRDFPAARGDASLGGEPGRRGLRPGEDDEDPSTGPGQGTALSGTADHGVPRWISGVAVHAVLGNLDFARDSEAAVREAARARLREDLDGEPPAAALEEVVRWVEAFRGSDLGRQVAAAALRQAEGEGASLLREVPFLAREEGVLLRGQIDLVFRGADGAWVLADYKAGAPPRHGGSRRRYERQLQLYARALRGMPLFRRETPGRGVLVYLDPGPEVVEVALEAGAMESARGLLGRFRDGAESERWSPDRGHCRMCPFGPSGTRACGVGMDQQARGGKPWASAGRT
jgi:ATP-dependent exoDNAse (exonuclease V) beta subunit